MQVELGGVLQLPKATRVRAVREHGGSTYVFIDGTETGFRVENVRVDTKSPGAATPAPRLPLSEGQIRREEEGGDEGFEMDRFTVDEGVVKISFPSGMTADSVEELEEFFKLFIKKAKRRAGAEKPN